ncbi:microtubule-actin cross-linking factor 1, isoforms 6/7-like [Physella acuta]|uniref:microtubule-actin cross-linking factor 1, isoforms 6/7-like n=1 Tax=Physella acuta TaxID=109671 RepID=UPI0027DE24D6|nr:microtubule-actin cross-linking factor 1, isoforms 6/7-like [Physella acuta]XP_059155080.1 microtubule-actin cross-linking factor 1, isoforms 6/7-like [Physella acuta]
MSSMSITWYISAVILFLGVLPSNCQDHKDLNGTGSGDPAPHGDSNQTRTTGNNTGHLTVQHFEELSRELKDLSQSAQELQNMTQQTLDWRRVLMVIEEILLNMLLFFWGFYVGVRYYRIKCKEKDNRAVLTMRVPNFDSGTTLVMYMRPPEGESRQIQIHRTDASSPEITVVPLGVVPDPPSPEITVVPLGVVPDPPSPENTVVPLGVVPDPPSPENTVVPLGVVPDPPSPENTVVPLGVVPDPPSPENTVVPLGVVPDPPSPEITVVPLGVVPDPLSMTTAVPINVPAPVPTNTASMAD